MAPVKGQATAQNFTEPQSKRQLNTREKIILLGSSKLHGCVFTPWSSEPEASDFAAEGSAIRYVDDTQFALSDGQAEILDDWRPSDDILKNAGADQLVNRKQLKGGLDLIQDITTDCSVVASLCAIVSRIERGYHSLFAGVLYPWDQAQQKPDISPNGKHILKFYFNGSYRRVVIDNRLPESKTDRKLYVIDRSDPAVIWPALVEKAYLKVRGGYDFPGSNSGTDIWVLTGWIPEQLFLQSGDLDHYALWQRIFRALNYGDVLITMGTGKMTETEERGLGLVGEHDYAVLDMKECKGQKLFLVKNPWSKAITWKGHVSYADELAGDFVDLKMDDLIASDKPTRTSLTPGTFWIGFDQVVQSFESIYLNWNPGLFSHREDAHFMWDLTTSSSPESCFRSNPQYAMSSCHGGILWVLLSRHIKSRHLPSERPKGAVNCMHGSHEGFISLYAFDKGGYRVSSSEDTIATSHYVDSPNILLKVDIPPRLIYTIVVSHQSLPKTCHTFTISILSLTPASLAPAKDQYSHTLVQRDRWTASTSGGNTSSHLYTTNPQYGIKFLDTANASLVLETASDSLLVNVKLLWGSGHIVRSVTTRDILGDSGEYTKSFALAEMSKIPAGAYTIICSTFEQGQTGEFSLHVSATSPCYVNRLPTLGAGRFVSKVREAFFAPRVDRIMMSLSTYRINEVTVTAKSKESQLSSERGTMSPLKVSIELGKGSSKQVIAVSGNDEFIDTSLTSACLQDVCIEPSMSQDRGLWIALERLTSSSSNHDEPIDIKIHSDQPIGTGLWTT